MLKGQETYCFSEKALYSAWLRVERNRGGPGVDGETIEDFRKGLERKLSGLSKLLNREEYVPMPLRKSLIPKENGGLRELGIPTIRDRIVFQAINTRLQSLWEPFFSPLSFAYRPGRGVNDAIGAIKKFLEDGRTWYIKGDIRGCFDSLNWELLSIMIRHSVDDPMLSRLLNRAIRVPIFHRGNLFTRRRGVPQGSPVSPILCNLYLHQFDVRMSERGYDVVRYGDDWLVLTFGEKEAVRGFYTAADILSDLRIEIAEGKSGIGDLSRESIVFLGYGIGAGEVTPSAKAWSSFNRAIGDLGRAHRQEDFVKARARLLHLGSQYRNSGRVDRREQRIW